MLSLSICALLITLSAAQDIPQPCDSHIYCQGKLLHTIQMAKIYDDSKTFVDMKMLHSPQETLKKFEDFMTSHEDKPTSEQVKNFVEEHFDAGEELEVAEPVDWNESPDVIRRLADPNLREWASHLNMLWKNLTRKISNKIKTENDKYSLIYVPNQFVVPGGRFREFYYWDTYWVVRGLLVSGMKETVRGMLENFIHMVKTYGHVPNGGRLYYIQRSQPPLLLPMVDSYFDETEDLAFIKENINDLEKEFKFWMDHRTVKVEKNGRTYTLARYYAVSQGPRPESYREDYSRAHKTFDDEARRQEFYVDIKSAAESGWDFSSRWYIKDGISDGDLSDIHTRYIIPVDLNAFLYGGAHILAKLYGKLDNEQKAEEYAKIADTWKEAVTDVLWNEDAGAWFDYDILNNKSREYFFASNVAPLWTGCYEQARVETIAQKVVNYLLKNEAKTYIGGIPTSRQYTNEQWDYPNAWPPLQMIIIQGLARTKQINASNLAYDLANKWVHSNYKGYLVSGDMFEKYNVEFAGVTGGHGEYAPQAGFGWTNGAILELLSGYAKRLKIRRSGSNHGDNNMRSNRRRRHF